MRELMAGREESKETRARGKMQKENRKRDDMEETNDGENL